MKNNLCGIVIGPIYETIMNSKSLAQHWLASYLFSEISRSVVKELNLQCEKNNCEINFLAPRASKENYDKLGSIGRFPDQILFEVKGSLETTEQIIKETINSVKTNNNDNYTVNNFGNDYFKINYVISPNEQLSTLLQYVNSLDNALSNYIIKDKLFINKFYSNPKKHLEDFRVFNELYSDIAKHDTKSFDSIEQLISDSKFNNSYAMIYYDGNSVGKILGSYFETNKKKYEQISSDLFKFSDSVANLLATYDYPHLPLYIAGDDGFIIMPMTHSNEDGEKLFLDLLHEINELYNKHVTTHNNALTLRFSVSIAEKSIPFKKLYEQVYDNLYTCKNLDNITPTDESYENNNILINIVRKGAKNIELGYDFKYLYNSSERSKQSDCELNKQQDYKITSTDLLTNILAGNKGILDEMYIPTSFIYKLNEYNYIIDRVYDSKDLANSLKYNFELNDSQIDLLLNIKKEKDFDSASHYCDYIFNLSSGLFYLNDSIKGEENV